MASTDFDEMLAVVGDELTVALLREGCLALRWPHDVENQLRLRVMDDADLGPLARNLAVLWYTGGWVQLPADWRQRHGANSLDSDRLLSARSWTEGLMCRPSEHTRRARRRPVSPAGSDLPHWTCSHDRLRRPHRRRGHLRRDPRQASGRGGPRRHGPGGRGGDRTYLGRL